MSWRIKAEGPYLEVVRAVADCAEMPHSLRLAIAEILSETNGPDGASVQGYGLSADGSGIGTIDMLEVQKYWLATKLVTEPQP